MMLFDMLAGFLSGMILSMGLGGGSVLVLYLSLVRSEKQIKAQGLNLLFFIPVAVVSLIFHIKNKFVDIKTGLIGMSFALAGGLGGFLLTNVIDESIIKKIFGALLLYIGVTLFFQKKKTGNQASKES